MLTAYDALVAERARDGSRPLVTFHDDSSGERMELSVASVDNAVSKVAGLLRDGLDLQPGAVCAIHLPLHWQLPVVVLACWTAGLAIAPGADPASTDVCVLDLDHMALADPGGDALIASLEPFGMPVREPLAPGCADLAVESRTYPDRFSPLRPPGPQDDAVLLPGGTRLTHADVVTAARREEFALHLGRGSRLLVEDAADAWLSCAALPLLTGSSVVMVRHADASRRAAHVQHERITASWPVA